MFVWLFFYQLTTPLATVEFFIFLYKYEENVLHHPFNILFYSDNF